MKFLKKATYIRYLIAKLSNCPSQHADFHRILFTEDSLKIKKGFGTSFQPTFLIDFFDKKIHFVILHKLAKFHYQIVFTSQVIQ